MGAGLMRWGALWGRSQDAIIVGIETRDRQRELLPPTGDAAERKRWPSAGESAAVEGGHESGCVFAYMCASAAAIGARMWCVRVPMSASPLARRVENEDSERSAVSLSLHSFHPLRPGESQTPARALVSSRFSLLNMIPAAAESSAWATYRAAEAKASSSAAAAPAGVPPTRPAPLAEVGQHAHQLPPSSSARFTWGDSPLGDGGRARGWQGGGDENAVPAGSAPKVGPSKDEGLRARRPAAAPPSPSTSSSSPDNRECWTFSCSGWLFVYTFGEGVGGREGPGAPISRSLACPPAPPRPPRPQQRPGLTQLPMPCLTLMPPLTLQAWSSASRSWACTSKRKRRERKTTVASSREPCGNHYLSSTPTSTGQRRRRRLRRTHTHTRTRTHTQPCASREGGWRGAGTGTPPPPPHTASLSSYIPLRSIKAIGTSGGACAASYLFFGDDASDVDRTVREGRGRETRHGARG